LRGPNDHDKDRQEGANGGDRYPAADLERESKAVQFLRRADPGHGNVKDR